MKITFRLILNPVQNLQKVGLYVDGISYPVSVEKLGNSYTVRADIGNEVITKYCTDKETALLVAKGLAFDLYESQQPSEQPSEINLIEWRFNKGKYRAYLPGSRSQFKCFNCLSHAQNWAKKYSHMYRFIKPLPQKA